MLRDRKIIGFVVGIISPILGMLGYWFAAFGFIGLSNLDVLFKEPTKLSAVISLGLIVNLGCFFFFYRRKQDENARGIILATFTYGLLIVFLKFS